ncbi:winged helix-turn-helix transcriptional regulator [Pedobacter sp. N23S346]|uniref:winged helix-turn-helix transcriptional regulator n=1 Tax=Pedobacter sp. N23S346 TaxID=3402750 RepID=UPI003AD704BE
MNNSEKNFEECTGQCPIRNVLDRIGDKWSMLVLLILGSTNKMRFNELHKGVGDISQKMLTVTLKTLEADGLVKRTAFPEIPPRVEYNLTERGRSLIPHLKSLTQWAEDNMPGIEESRELKIKASL